MKAEISLTRIDYLDYARGLGIFLVYYGHLVEKLYRLGGVENASLQWKLVYSFHLPFFFFLAGVFWKQTPLSWDFFYSQLKKRLIPCVTFSLMLVPPWYLFAPREFWNRISDGGYFIGIPRLNVVMWFLVCLMMVELLAAWIVKYLRLDSFRLLFYAVASFCLGYFVLVRQVKVVTSFTTFHPSFWYIDDAFVVLVFYFMGFLFRTALSTLNGRIGWWICTLLALVSGVVLLLSYGLNDVPSVVLLISSQYGDPLYFLISAFSGIVFLLSFSRLIAWNFHPLRFVGQNALIFMGLNGFGLQFLDRFAILHLGFHPVSHWEIFLYSSLYIFAVMTLSAPVVYGLRRWFPELVGSPWTSTSLLPPIGEWRQHGFGPMVGSFMKKYILN